MDKKEVRWRAAEYAYAEKDISWYGIVILSAVILIVIALWQKNFFFALFILIAAIALVAFGRHRPSIIEFKVTDKGIGIGKNLFYNYDDLEDFSVRERQNNLSELIIKRRVMVDPYFKMPVDAKSLGDARTLLKNKLPEVAYEESFIENLAEFLGW